MINELNIALQAYKRAGFVSEVWDKRIKNASKKLTFLVSIKTDGSVSQVKHIADQEEKLKFITYQPSTGGLKESSPAFNAHPLFVFDQSVIEESEYNKKVSQLKNKLKNGELKTEKDRNRLLKDILLCSKNNWCDCKASKKRTKTKIDNCLNRLPKDILEYIKDLKNDKYIEPLRVLLNSLIKTNSEKLHEQMKSIIIKHIVSDGDKISTGFIECLFEKQFQIILNLDGIFMFKTNPAWDLRTWKKVSDVLLSTDGSNNKKQKIATDMFGRLIEYNKDDKFPEVVIPVLGQVKIYSKNHNKAYQKRYELLGSSACLLSVDTQNELAWALKELTSLKNEHKTWDNITGSIGYGNTSNQAILIVHPINFSEEIPGLSSVFAGILDTRFEELSEKVIKGLVGKKIDLPDDARIQIFILNKKDKQNVGLAFSSAILSLDDFRRVCADWESKCKNIPEIIIPYVNAKKNIIGFRSNFLIPAPAMIPKILNRQYILAGIENIPSQGVNINQAMTIMLEDSYVSKKTAEAALDVMVRNTFPLLKGIAVLSNRIELSKGPSQIPSGMRKVLKYNRDIAYMPSIVSLLLNKIKGRFCYER